MRNCTFSLTLKEIAELTKTKLVGDENLIITGISVLEYAKKGDISFLSHPKYMKNIKNTQATAVIVPENFENHNNVLLAKDPRLALAYLMNFIQDIITIKKTGISDTAVIGKNCKIAKSVYIGPNSVIGDNVIINENTKIMANVSICDNVKIGKNCLINCGTVIGSDGFGFAVENEKWLRIPHLGSVVIGDNVDIGSNSTIDRGLLEDTIIEDNVIIDNLVQIAHNVKVGKATAIAGCVGVAGSTKIGANCLIGGSSGIAGHINIADKVHITAKSGINSSIKNSGSYSSGLPGKPTSQWRRNVACFNNLNDFFKRLKKLEKAEQID